MHNDVPNFLHGFYLNIAIPYLHLFLQQLFESFLGESTLIKQKL